MPLFLVSNEEMQFHHTYKIFELESQNTQNTHIFKISLNTIL